MADRGDYRSFYCAFWDNADTHALSDRGYRVLTTLKGTLNAAGIGIVYVAQLAERCGKSTEEIIATYEELERQKPDDEVGWIVRDRNIVWIVNGLRYEPSLTSNNAKHRAFVRDRCLAPLGDVPIVAAFRRHYPEWFPGAVQEPPQRPGAVQESGAVRTNNVEGQGAAPNPHDRPSDAAPMAHRTLSKQSPSSNQPSPSLSNPTQSSPARSQPSASEGASKPIASPSALLAAAANRAITERWREQPNPIRHDAVPSMHLADDLTAAGIPIEFACDAVYTHIKDSTSLSQPPKSLKYSHGYVFDQWRARAEHAAAASSGAKRLVGANGSGGDLSFTEATERMAARTPRRG
jgi:hypothetical protein